MGLGFVCCCGCTVHYSGAAKICSTFGSTPAAAGATVTIKNHATGAVLDTRTTDSSGNYSGSFNLASGSSVVVDVVIALGNGSVTSAGRTFTCTGANTVPTVAVLVAKTNVFPKSCGTPGVAGATVTLTVGGSPVTQTSDASGNTAFYLAAGTYSYSISGAARYATKTGTLTVPNPASNCTQTVSVQLTPAAGYVCWCNPGRVPYPVATTLTATGVSASGVALTYTLTYSAGPQTWVSSLVPVTVPGPLGCCSGPTPPVTVNTRMTLCSGLTSGELGYQVNDAYGTGCPDPTQAVTDTVIGLTAASYSAAAPFAATYSLTRSPYSDVLLANCGTTPATTVTVTE